MSFSTSFKDRLTQRYRYLKDSLTAVVAIIVIIEIVAATMLDSFPKAIDTALLRVVDQSYPTWEFLLDAVITCCSCSCCWEYQIA